MKKLFIFLTAICFSFSVYAQKAEEIKVSVLPKNVTGYITQNMKKATMERAAKLVYNKNTVGYCVSVAANGRKSIFVFDKNGNYLDRVKRMSDVQGVFKTAKPQTQTQAQPAKK